MEYVYASQEAISLIPLCLSLSLPTRSGTHGASAVAEKWVAATNTKCPPEEWRTRGHTASPPITGATLSHKPHGDSQCSPAFVRPRAKAPPPAIRLGLARAHDARVHTQQLSLDADTFTLTLALRRQHDPLACFTCPAPTTPIPPRSSKGTRTTLRLHGHSGLAHSDGAAGGYTHTWN
ncbi:uncharacterized protein Tco025E_02858, partial [Trypanosoma conorhini]